MYFAVSDDVGESDLSLAGDMVEGEEKVVAVSQVGRQFYFHLVFTFQITCLSQLWSSSSSSSL